MINADRLKSLDVFRGITIAAMLIVNAPGNEHAYAWLDHAEWHGWTPTDLVFPFFLFAVGMALVFSIDRRLEGSASSTQTLVKQILIRTAILFGIGMILNGFPYYRLSTIRIPGVLQRIAVCYGLAAYIYLFFKQKLQRKTAPVLGVLIALLLLGYWWVMTHIAAPGLIVGDLTREGNLAAWLDRTIFHKHIYRPDYDPEGLLSTFPALASTLVGVLVAMWVKNRERSSVVTWQMSTIGLACLGVGLFWGQTFPINKALWTSSYVLLTTGWALLVLAVCYETIDVKGWAEWSKPFEIFGTNAIFVYFVPILFLKLQNLWKMPRPSGAAGNARYFITDHLFLPWLSPKNASLAYALTYTLIWFGVLTVLYRKKIFLKF